MNKKKTAVNGLEIEYILEGPEDKPVILFAHGLGGNVDQWAPQIEHFKDKNRVLAFSLQGHGNSSKPVDKKYYTIDAYSATVMALLSQLEISSCYWVGNSMGGVVGYDVLEKNPRLINHLITNGTTPELKFSSFAVKLVEIADKILFRLMGFEKYIRFAVKNSTKDPAIQEALFKVMVQTASGTIIESHKALANYSYIDVIKRGQKGITIIRAPEDKSINQSIDKHKELLDSLDYVTQVTIEDAGHIVNMEKPDAYNTIIESIIK